MGDDAEKLIDYFQAIPGVSPCPLNYNPANWMLEVSSPANEEALGIDFAQVFSSSSLSRDMDAAIAKHEVPKPGAAPLQIL